MERLIDAGVDGIFTDRHRRAQGNPSATADFWAEPTAEPRRH